VFALDPGQFGAGRGQCAGRLVAGGLELGLPRLLLLQPGTGGGKRLACVVAPRPSGDNRRFRIALGGKRRELVGVAPALAIEALEAALGRGKLSFSDTPLGFDPGLSRGGLSEGQFGGARSAVGLLERAGKRRVVRFGGGHRGFALGHLTLEPGQRLGRVAGHAVGLAAVLVEADALTVEIGQALFGGFELAG
jgi:hypothetical protein